LRGFIYQLASLVIFALIIWTLLAVILAPSLETSICGFYQEAGRKQTLESDTLVTLWIIRCATFVVVLFLVRLYLSMELFDSHYTYFHDFVQPLHPVFRTLEWLMRFIIMLYLLLSLHFGFDRMSGHIVSVVRFTYPEPMAAAKSLRSQAVCLTTFFLLLFLWDCVYIIATIWSTVPLRRFFVRFMLPHLTGLGTWGLIGFIFWSRKIIYYQPMVFAIVSTLTIGSQFLFVLWSLFVGSGGKTKYRLLGKGSLFKDFFGLHLWEKLVFLIQPVKCDIQHD